MEELMNQAEGYLGTIDWGGIIAGSLRILLILVLGWIAARVIRAALHQLQKQLMKREAGDGVMSDLEAAKRADTLVGLLRQGAFIALWLLVGLIVLRELGLDIAPILAGAGVLGLAVGFGAQNLVRDVITGFFILLENQARVGDVAVINGAGGVVERINFRTIVLRDMSGTVHYFPNGTITTLANMTQEWSGYVMDIGVAYKEDTDRCVEVMKAVAAEMQQDEYFGKLFRKDLEVFGVDDFGDSAVIIKARITTPPIKQWEVGREYRRRLKKAFDAHGIEIPFPHRSVYFGEASPPVLLKMQEEQARQRGEQTPDTALKSTGAATARDVPTPEGEED